MIPIPDISQTYPKTSLTLDTQFTGPARFVSGGSAFFDGSNDSVQVDGFTLATSSASYSMMFWFKTDSTSSDQRMFVIQNTTSGAKCLLYMNNGSILHFNGTASTTVSATSSMNDGNWHCLHHTVASGTTGKFYIDGKEEVSKTVTNIDLSAADDMRIGSNNTGSANFFNGYIANVAVWQGTALSVDQVRQTMSANSYAVTNSVATLRGYWQLVDDYNDDAGTQNGTNSGSALSLIQVRLPAAYDDSGKVNNAFPTRLARAMDFDGTGDYVDCGVGVDPTSSGSTLVAWVKPGTVASGGLSSILESGGGGNSRFGIGLSESESKFYVTRFWGADYDGKKSTEIQADQWYHVVGTVSADGSATTLYVNGVSQSGAYGSNKSVSGSSVTAIGRWQSGTSYYFDGGIAHAKVFNTVLTADQVAELYHNPTQALPSGVAAANLKRFYALQEFTTTGTDSLNQYYMMDSGADGVNGYAYGGTMIADEKDDCPQLGLMPSSARYLSQVDDLYTITQDSDINALFASGGSMSFWICPFSTGEGGFGRIIDASNTGHLLLIQAESGGSAQLAFIHFFDGDDGNWKLTNRDVPIGSWSHIVITYNSSDVANDPVIYVNGSSKAITEDVDPTGTVNADNSNKIIGNQAGNGRAFDGYISECAMWKTVLDADAVTAIYNSGVQGFDLSTDAGNYDVSSSLKGWWKLNNLFTVQDLTSFNNDAVASGSPVLSIVPEGGTPGQNPFGNTEEKVAGNAVFNLNGNGYFTIPFNTDIIPIVAAGPTNQKGFTLSVWAKKRNFGTSTSDALFDTGSGSNRWYLKVRSDSSNTVQFNFGTGDGSTDVDNINLSDADWHHYVFVLESDGTNWTNGKMWADGARVQSGGSDRTVDISARNGNNCSTTADITIGSEVDTVDWDGSVAFPKIYARSLSDAEVKLLYQSNARTMRYIQDV